MQKQQQTTVLVTGTNRGLGNELAKILLSSHSTHPNLSFLFTVRSLNSQVQSLRKEWSERYPSALFEFKTLDLGSEDSIDKFVQNLKSQNKWKFSAIVNNAAIGLWANQKLPKHSQAYPLFQTNVVGTIKLTNLLLPFLTENGRIVNISSQLGALEYQTEEVRNIFLNPQISQTQILETVEQFLTLTQEGQTSKNAKKWFPEPYHASKMLLNAWTRFVLSKKLKPTQYALAACPGWCTTDMGGNAAFYTPESGGRSIYDLVFLENPNPQQFYQRGVPNNFLTCGTRQKIQDKYSQKN